MNTVSNDIVTTRWRREDVALLDEAGLPEIARVDRDAARRAMPSLHLWDCWPLCRRDGTVADVGGAELWMVLSAPAEIHPDGRHDIARIRLLTRNAAGWHDCGNLLPDGFSPGTREWAGSAVLDGDDRLVLYYTATGRRDEPFSFEQRMFETTGRLEAGGMPRVVDWSAPAEIVRPDPRWYADTRTTRGGAGQIDGFRDPGIFRDPADGSDYVVFTASHVDSTQSHTGVIGLARRGASGWQALPPLIDGNGLNNELERPHILARDGCYYLFWSTQRHVFAPGGPSGPNGLYGMVADRIAGPWVPLNGTGLVAANPESEPMQTYSWLVLPSLEVASFVDLWGLNGRTRAANPDVAVTQFGGTPAPFFKIVLDGSRATLG